MNIIVALLLIYKYISNERRGMKFNVSSEGKDLQALQGSLGCGVRPNPMGREVMPI
jgi:hypothetical protein